MTKVVNLRLEKCDVKICRNQKGKIPNPPEYGCFGNPFYLKDVHDDKKRAEVIEKYRIYFYNRIKTDKIFLDSVLSLKGKTLGCFCKQPNKEVACHGDVIVEFLESYEFS